MLKFCTNHGSQKYLLPRNFQSQNRLFSMKIYKDIEILKTGTKFVQNLAIRDLKLDNEHLFTQNQHQYKYSDLENDSLKISQHIVKLNDAKNFKKISRISFLCPPSYSYVATLFSIWKLGYTAIPLCYDQPLSEIEYVVLNSQTSLILIYHKYKFLENIKTLCNKHKIAFIVLNEFFSESNDFEANCTNRVDSKNIQVLEIDNANFDREALVLYTSGTTGKPKGVILTHKALEAQIKSLVCFQKQSYTDHILHTLPLHHTHGIVNKLLCALYVGAKISFFDLSSNNKKFDASRFYEVIQNDHSINVYMAVPTIYSRLISYYERLPLNIQEKIKRRFEKFRLMVSGSSALSPSLAQRQANLLSFPLLERYGMTECGMILSNSLNVKTRQIGYVGCPLPGVNVRIDDTGVLQVKSLGMFKEYLNNVEATQKAFDNNGQFCTGDLVQKKKDVMEDQEPIYKILGRQSVDIIKSAGYKISSLEIEQVLSEHEYIDEIAVVGIPDEEYGQIIVACIVLKKEIKKINEKVITKELKSWSIDKLARYKAPRQFHFVNEIPCKNAMGKVNKLRLIEKLFMSI